MSFPKIPDINPEINITFEDSINLLLASVALEEISLSKLIEAEKDKILFVLNNCDDKETALHNAIDINKSVDSTIKNMIKLQMLLQFKLENIIEIIPTTTTSTTTSSSTTTTASCTRTTTTKCLSTTTTTHTTTCSTSTCSTTTKKKCGCSLIGKGKGCITNKSDKYFNCPVYVKAFIFKNNINDGSLSYLIENDCHEFYMVARENSIKMECPQAQHPEMLTIYGKGFIREKPDSCAKNLVYFELRVWDEKIGKRGFQMKIRSESKHELNHDSGFVQTRNPDYSLKIETY